MTGSADQIEDLVLSGRAKAFQGLRGGLAQRHGRDHRICGRLRQHRPRTRPGLRPAGPGHDLPQDGLPGTGHLLGAAAWGERGCGDDVRGDMGLYGPPAHPLSDTETLSALWIVFVRRFGSDDGQELSCNDSRYARVPDLKNEHRLASAHFRLSGTVLPH